MYHEHVQTNPVRLQALTGLLHSTNDQSTSAREQLIASLTRTCVVDILARDYWSQSAPTTAAISDRGAL